MKKKLTIVMCLLVGLFIASYSETVKADSSKELSFQVYRNESGWFSPRGLEVSRLVETDDAYIFSISNGSGPATADRDMLKRFALFSQAGKKYTPTDIHEDLVEHAIWYYTVTFKKDNDLTGMADAVFRLDGHTSDNKIPWAVLCLRFDTGRPVPPAPPAPPVVPETDQSVVLYGDYNGGRKQKVINDYPVSSPNTEYNDDLSSVKLPSGVSITLYEDANYGGRSVTLANKTNKTETYNLSSDFNDKMSSYKITSNYVKLYSNYNGEGEIIKHGASFASVSRMSSHNDSVSSVALPAHTTIVLYDNTNFTGKSEVITNRTNATAVYNVSSAFNDKTSSYDISEEIPAGLYNKKITSIQSIKDVWNVLDWNMSNLDQVITYHNNGNTNQKWQFLYDASDDTYQIMCGPLNINGSIRSAYLVAGTSTNSGGSTYLSTKNSQAEKSREKWRLIKTGSHENGNVFMFRNVATGKVMDMPGGKSSEALILYTSSATDNQKFVVHVE